LRPARLSTDVFCFSTDKFPRPEKKFFKKISKNFRDKNLFAMSQNEKFFRQQNKNTLIKNFYQNFDYH